MSGIREAIPSIAALTATATLLAGCGGQSTVHDTYYALGDSVAAGLGLPQSQEASSEDRLCGRSTEAYPAIVAADLHLAVANLACSGAVAANLLTTQNVEGSIIPAQLDRAFAEGSPKLITITVGANDVDWSGFLKSCFGGDSCNTEAANADLTHLSHELEDDLQTIQEHSSADRSQVPTTVVTGYYNPASSRCTNLSPTNLNQLNNQVDALNTTLKNATQDFSFVRFAPVEDGFVGHDACSSQPWVQPLGPASLHPTAQGQAAMAKAVLHALEG